MTQLRDFIKNFDFNNLFNELGWDHFGHQFRVQTWTLTGIAQKREVQVFLCQSDTLPPYSARQQIEKEVTQLAFEHLIIFANTAKTTQIWQWVARTQGKPTAYREYTYHVQTQSLEQLIQKLQSITFSLQEEECLTLFGVVERLKDAFDKEKLTKKFYDEFKKQHDHFLKFVQGIAELELQQWYVSVLINRLMFIYFIQAKGFLNSDLHYLRHQLEKFATGDYFHDFLCILFFEGFAQPEAQRSSATRALLGKIPYLNGGLFLHHVIEGERGKNLPRIQISNQAFTQLFNFFDQYRWHLDERPIKQGNEIHPDVLGYIFEKYINQKQMGAYYTKEDITEYISKNTIIPFLFTETLFSQGFKLLAQQPDRYIYPAVKRGVELLLPDDIAQGLEQVSLRTAWNQPATAEYALPTEIWREVVARRQRYAAVKATLENGEIRDIHDFITYNLNIRQFAQDAIENTDDVAALATFWERLQTVTVLDPTCGSGAFLLAALEVLQPLYEACLERMEAFVNDANSLRIKPFSPFVAVLQAVAKHPNRMYFILKSIIVRNLYGVDMMAEAVEIAKLRLFLKLVAHLEKQESQPNFGIEPLPDIDFNIRVGNTLVGFATFVEFERFLSSQLNLQENLVNVIRLKAENLRKSFEEFQRKQLANEDVREIKGIYQTDLLLLQADMNHYLATEYGVKESEFAGWLQSHQPFHWFIEFFGIIEGKGGFDVIIGNPPYVEYSKVKGDYLVKGYETEKCGNLYAFVMERGLNIMSSEGYFGMITPVSLGASPRMLPLRMVIKKKVSQVYYSNFADRPSCLFNGVHQILSICISKKSVEKMPFCIKSTSFKHWTQNERNYTFLTINYMESTQQIFDEFWGKFGYFIESNIYNKLTQQRKSIFSYFSNQGHLLAICGGTGGYWLRCFDESQSSNEYKNRYVINQDIQLVLCGILNSNLFYWLWRKYSDCRHLTNVDLEKFTFDFDSKITQKMLSISYKHLSFLKKTKEVRTGKMTYEQYRPSHVKPLIDEIDRVLAQHYGFTEEELDFIINYDIKYRMGKQEED